MAKCPICSAEITGLFSEKFFSAVVMKGSNVWYNPEVRALEREEMPERDGRDIRDLLGEIYYCPSCCGEVAETYGEALEILKGEGEQCTP